MRPRGLLMIEHRLIEKFLAVAKEKTSQMGEETYNPIFIDTLVDFIKVYADRTHHGKEEDILFKELESKKVNAADTKIMAELVDEHKQARLKVQELTKLNDAYRRGDHSVVPAIVKIIHWLAEFYPVHIVKEDKVFFPDTEAYFSEGELGDLLDEFYEFDQKMIHEKYQNVYKQINEK